MTKVKMMYNGIKIDGKLFGGHWSNGPYVNGNEGMITFYAAGYGPIPNIGFEITNDSDAQSDYIVEDVVRFRPGQPYYNEAVNAYKLHKAKAEKRHQAYLLRNGVTV